MWVGNTDATPMIATSGITGAGPIWHAVMEFAHRDLPVEKWERPASVREVTVCEISGLLPTEYCPTRKEYFIAGTETGPVRQHLPPVPDQQGERTTRDRVHRPRVA
ncbi:MAG: hypothetical protein M5R40_21405 [Anaerolineae bacterium]|nr:hypothetical protein [Anaerolineae bacterium]